MKCDYCKELATYFYEWMQSKQKREASLCVYCHFQLKGEMLKQECVEEMVHAVKLELEDKEEKR